MYGLLAIAAFLLGGLAQGARAGLALKETLANHKYASDATALGIKRVKIEGDSVTLKLRNDSWMTIRDPALARDLSANHDEHVDQYGKPKRSSTGMSRVFNAIRRTDYCQLECDDNSPQSPCELDMACTCLKHCGPHGVGCGYACFAE